MTDQPIQVIIPPEIVAMSNDELIAEHRKIGDYVTTQNKAFAEHLKPLREREDYIERQLFVRLAEMNKGKDPAGKRASISTDAGTAYLSTIVTPKVLDKIQWLDWVLADWDNRNAMLQIGAPQKQAFDEYVQEAGDKPPHTDISTFTRVNIRKA